MISSAKMIAVSLLAAATLGAAGGCSKKAPDKSGGIELPDSGIVFVGSSGNSGKPSSSSDKCAPQQDADFISADCQACLTSSCCTELKDCFDLPTDGEKVDCNSYATCNDDCATKKGADQQKCFDDCDATAADGVVSAYANIEDCAVAHCKTPCSAQ